ncbi:MAG: CBS domain-containing protein [Pleurocapsa sp.]
MMEAQEIMTRDVVTVSGSATVAEAVKLMKDKSLRALIVERRGDWDSYGIVTETDIIYKVAAYGHDPKKMRVYEIMTKPCITVNPHLGVEYVARLFANTGIRRAPVIKDKLLGIISVSDILKKSDFVEKPKSNFELYCEENPDALEARIYED